MLIPEELEPVTKSLSVIVGMSKSACGTLGPDGQCNVPSANHTLAEDFDSNFDEDNESLAKFPLGKRYPFTFKLMVHMPYRVDEWAKKVEQMLEKSKMVFKSLNLCLSKT